MAKAGTLSTDELTFFTLTKSEGREFDFQLHAISPVTDMSFWATCPPPPPSFHVRSCPAGSVEGGL